MFECIKICLAEESADKIRDRKLSFPSIVQHIEQTLKILDSFLFDLSLDVVNQHRIIYLFAILTEFCEDKIDMILLKVGGCCLEGLASHLMSLFGVG